MPKKKVSSRKKLSTKAATRTPSTTSSTTAKAAKKKSPAKKKTPRKTTPPVDTPQDSEQSQVEQQSAIPPATFLKSTETPQALSEEVQYAYITLLSRGASPAAACSQLGILLAEVIWTLEQIPEFASMVDRVQELLSQNVAAALYRSAMEGSVSAQQNYLKAYPPPENGATENESMNDPEQNLTEDELIEYLKAEAKAFLAEFDQDSAIAENSQTSH